ncbi:MAG: methyltransferase family protein [Phycisphaerales bacterium JB063]
MPKMLGTLQKIHDAIDARRAACLFYVFQALAVPAWWFLLVLLPTSRDWFFPTRLTGDPLMSFWLADLTLLAGGSLLACYAVAMRRAWATAVSWFVAAAAAYPTLYTLVLAGRYGEGMVGAGLMGLAAGLAAAFATIVGNDARPAGFRTAHTSSTPVLLLRVLVQIVLFWGLFLGLLPLAIAEAEQRLGLPAFVLPVQRVLGLVLFFLAGALGVWSAWSMATLGRGTPLPTDCAPRLVVTGPYRYLRNPMASAGIAQGVGVGVTMGSFAVLAYAFLGALVWHWGARPAEERDLLERFGQPYWEYRSAVRCWVPSRGFSSSTSADSSCNPPGESA